MAEWLSRWTLDLMGTLRAGLNPGTGDLLFLNDNGGLLRSNASKRKVQALMQVRSTRPEGAKRPSASTKRKARGSEAAENENVKHKA